jgi:uroporphyrinogen-III synthase
MILNLRPVQHHAAFHRDFGVLGLPTFDCPILRAVPTDETLPPLDSFDAVILTSAITLNFLPQNAAWHDRPVFAVGAATAAAAHRFGFHDITCAEGTAADLARAFAGSRARRALYPSAAEPSRALEADFPGRVTRVPVYRMVARTALPPGAIGALAGDQPVYVPLFSQRSAAAFASCVGLSGLKRPIARTTAIGISAAALNVPRAAWAAAVVASQPTAAAMVASLHRALDLARAA